jgi:tetratricopeptide (TPR) repeat protein
MEKERGPKHPEVAKICNNIAEVYRHLGEISRAEQYCRRALAVFEEVYGTNSVHAIPPLSLLAAIYQQQGNYTEAETLFKQALAVTEAKLGPEHPDMASVLSAYVLLLREMERYDEAEELDEKALRIKRLWLKGASPLEMLREESAAMQRKYLKKGGMVYFNGVHMTVEDFLAIQTDSPEDEDTTPPEETDSD